jgi:hypothetical protein
MHVMSGAHRVNISLIQLAAARFTLRICHRHIFRQPHALQMRHSGSQASTSKYAIAKSDLALQSGSVLDLKTRCLSFGMHSRLMGNNLRNVAGSGSRKLTFHFELAAVRKVRRLEVWSLDKITYLRAPRLIGSSRLHSIAPTPKSTASVW